MDYRRLLDKLREEYINPPTMDELLDWSFDFGGLIKKSAEEKRK